MALVKFQSACILACSTVNVVPIVALYCFTNFFFSALLASLQRFIATTASIDPVKYGHIDSEVSARFLCFIKIPRPPKIQVTGLFMARRAFAAVVSLLKLLMNSFSLEMEGWVNDSG